MIEPRDKTLLFAEDELELLDLYCEWAQRVGCKVLRASNGEDALSICQRESIDLLISDVHMAAGNGIELARSLRTLEASPLVVFLTGYSEVSDEEAYDLGACAILNKPILRADLLAAVERFLKPLRDLWTTPFGLRPNTSIKRDYGSLESAMLQGELSFGRGGMFVRDVESQCDRVPVTFDFSFVQGQTPRIEGCGIPRWQRMTRAPDLPPGVGIEILNLASHALGPVTDWISRANPRAFIPKA